MLQSTISMLRVENAGKSEEFYTQKLGFAKSWGYDPGNGEPVFLEITRDHVSLHLSEHEGDGPLGIQLYINVDDAQVLHNSLIGSDVNVVEPLYDAEWGHRVFAIEDLDGNILRFGSPI